MNTTELFAIAFIVIIGGFYLAVVIDAARGKRPIDKYIDRAGWLKLKHPEQPKPPTLRYNINPRPGTFWYCEECAYRGMSSDGQRVSYECLSDACDHVEAGYHVTPNYDYYHE